MVTQALCRVCAIFRGEVHSVGDLHFIRKIFLALGTLSRCVRVGAASQQREGQG